MSVNETADAEAAVQETLDAAKSEAEAAQAAVGGGKGGMLTGARAAGPGRGLGCAAGLPTPCAPPQARPNDSLATAPPHPASPADPLAGAGGDPLLDGAGVTPQPLPVDTFNARRRRLLGAVRRGLAAVAYLPWRPSWGRRRLAQDVLAADPLDPLAALYDPSLAAAEGAAGVGAELPVPAVDARERRPCCCCCLPAGLPCYVRPCLASAGCPCRLQPPRPPRATLLSRPAASPGLTPRLQCCCRRPPTCWRSTTRATWPRKTSSLGGFWGCV